MSSPLPPDPYDALGVARVADIATIKKAHRVLVLKLHPDRSSDPNARDNFQNVQQAYEILLDPVRRQRYDDKQKLAQLPRDGSVKRSSQGGMSNRDFPVPPEAADRYSNAYSYRARDRESHPRSDTGPFKTRNPRHTESM